ncbi:MAG TPA: hypothetical protein VGQ99_08460 [Tepidisphaeraceae bacterium]|jgi:hypothetical protein|nr:hypothetical protein [Tepidisphaeraceae bacterium]HEV8605383.1 hypothetical protein [Tepidisphaeraceae bacterium]
MHLDHPASSLADVVLVAALALPAVLGWRGWRRERGIAIGWAAIVIVSQAVAILGYVYPRLFGWTKDDVHMPDAPDILPTALIALILSGIAFGVGSFAASRCRRSTGS